MWLSMEITYTNSSSVAALLLDTYTLSVQFNFGPTFVTICPWHLKKLNQALHSVIPSHKNITASWHVTGSFCSCKLPDASAPLLMLIFAIDFTGE